MFVKKGETLPNLSASYKTSRSNDHLHAFTLVELLVVIAIISLLAAILFPVFAQAKLAAHKTRDLAQLKQIGLGQLIYVEDFDSYFLSFPNGTTTSPFLNGELGAFWSDRQMPYIKSKDIYDGPTNDDQVYASPAYISAGATAPGQPHQYRVTYALNPSLTRAFRNPVLAGASNSTSVEEVSEVVLASSSQLAWPFSACFEQPAGSGQTHLVWMVSDYGWGYEMFGKKGLKGGFGGGLNFTFVDGHARYLRVTDAGTHPGDEYPFKAREFFRGRFEQAFIKKNVGTNGTCDHDRGELVY